MASTLTIRNVPESTRQMLASRAAAEGKSLQEYLLGHVNEMAELPTVAEVVTRARARLASTNPSVGTGPSIGTDRILDELDADRRR